MDELGVYVGEGTGDPTREGIQAFLTNFGLPWRPLGPDELTTEGLRGVAGIYWPGGWAWPYVRDVPPDAKRALRAMVASGGAYIGVCAGAYFAADLIRWEGRLVEYDLDLFDGTAEGPIDVIEPWRGWRMTSLDLVPHEIHAGASTQQALYWGGPALHPATGGRSTELARYRATGETAALTFGYGQGQVLLMGCHLELGWDPEAGRMDLAGGHGAQWPWLERAVRWTLAQGRDARAQGRR